MTRLCAHCMEPIKVIRTDDDWLDYCEGCHLIEGDTVEEIEEENTDKP